VQKTCGKLLLNAEVIDDGFLIGKYNTSGDILSLLKPCTQHILNICSIAVEEKEENFNHGCVM